MATEPLPIEADWPSEETKETMHRYSKRVDLRIEMVPFEWKDPLAVVLDTYEACSFAVVASQGVMDARAAVELTKLVITEKLRQEAKRPADEEG